MNAHSVYYFRERISLYSCNVVERTSNLVISTSHGLLNLQATMPLAISRFVMLMLCQFPVSMCCVGRKKVTINIFHIYYTPKSVYNYFCLVFVFDVLFCFFFICLCVFLSCLAFMILLSAPNIYI
jgi:hypothetical protein